LSSGTNNILQDYFKDKKVTFSSTTLSQKSAPTSVNVFQLPVDPEFERLTKSQRLFSLATGTDVRSLEISGDTEFFLFMEMRAEHQWASFRMTPHKWVTETNEYNARLRKQDAKAIQKNPRALMDKLIVIEVKIMERIVTNNFNCESAPLGCSRQALINPCSSTELRDLLEKSVLGHFTYQNRRQRKNGRQGVCRPPTKQMKTIIRLANRQRANAVA
jgi:hypothetical protein